MTIPRRRFLHLAVSAAVLSAVPRTARAQTYPSRPVRLIAGYPPGGGADIIARVMGQWLSDRLGHPFVIENRPGANTNIATEAVVRAVPDGYTLLLITAANAINTTLYDKLTFNFVRDIAAIGGVMRVPNVMQVNPMLPVRTVPEFIAHAKASPGKVNFASGGIGGGSHVIGELFKAMAGVDMVHVPYRGDAPALTDLIGGQVQVAFPTLPVSIEHIRAGKLRALAVTTATRSEALPELPTVSEFVPGFQASSWFGIGAPLSTPAEIINRLNSEIVAALADPKIRSRLALLGGAILPGSPADLGKLIVDETEKWAKVVRFAGIKPE